MGRLFGPEDRLQPAQTKLATRHDTIRMLRFIVLSIARQVLGSVAATLGQWPFPQLDTATTDKVPEGDGPLIEAPVADSRTNGTLTQGQERRWASDDRDRWTVPRFLLSGAANGAIPPVGMTVGKVGCLRRGDALIGGFLGGADFLPAAGALVVLQNFFAEADGFGSDFDELVVGDEFDGLLQAELAMGD